MQLSSYLLFLCLLNWAAGSDWCYTGCEHTPSEWSHIPGAFCGGGRQSPVNIVTGHVETNNSLGSFTLVNFDSQNAVKSIVNTGHTVKCNLEENQVEVSGGGLGATYSTLQFHFHWGTEQLPGSEHTVDGMRYAMEMHIVSLKKGLSVEQAKADPEGIAVLGFFLNATKGGDTSGPWFELVSYLGNLTDTDMGINANFSIMDLIGNVDLSKFYRYEGSLTTPTCNEAVVWTVFHEPINVNKALLEKFPQTAGYTDAYRPTQGLNGRRVSASPATPLPPSPHWCYGDHCDHMPPMWYLLPYSHCDGQRQSPVDIDTKKAVEDKHLGAFKFTGFDNKEAIENITNTGHTVKCKLMDGLVEVSGGGLGHVYSSLQLHFHWGSEGSHDSPGSEHTVDSKRYPMEMHIVNKRKDLNLTEALKTPGGLAALAFFIEASASSKRSSASDHHETVTSTNPTSDTSDNGAWKKLTSYFAAIPNISSEVPVTEKFSIDDLLGSVDRTAYYRYNGSLTTPLCQEVVTWTIFKEPIKVDNELIKMFPKATGYHNVFRPAQQLHNRTILKASSAHSSADFRCPATLLLTMTCLCALFIKH